MEAQFQCMSSFTCPLIFVQWPFLHFVLQPSDKVWLFDVSQKRWIPAIVLSEGYNYSKVRNMTIFNQLLINYQRAGHFRCQPHLLSCSWKPHFWGNRDQPEQLGAHKASLSLYSATSCSGMRLPQRRDWCYGWQFWCCCRYGLEQQEAEVAYRGVSADVWFLLLKWIMDRGR